MYNQILLIIKFGTFLIIYVPGTSAKIKKKTAMVQETFS